MFKQRADKPQVRQYIAFTPQEQLDYAAQGYVPVNVVMYPTPNRANQLQEHVFPGTWDNFNNVRYAGNADVSMLEWQLARAYGLGVEGPFGHPILRQFLRARLRAGDAQRRQEQQGDLHSQQALAFGEAPAMVPAGPVASGPSQQ